MIFRNRRRLQIEVRIAPAPNALQAPATALARTPQGLALGLPDGGIALCDRQGRGRAIRLPEPAAPTRRILVQPDGVLWRSGDALYRLKLADDTVELVEAPGLPDEPLPYARTPYEIRLGGQSVSTVYKKDFPGGDGPVALAEPMLAWATGDMLFRHDLRTGRREALVPWSGAKGAIQALLADGDTLWVATSGSGVLPLTPARDPVRGYVRVPLDPETQTPPARLAPLAEALQTFLGAPYKWGGITPAGCDCSGFVTEILKVGGVNPPRTSSALAKAGRPVVDSLQWGDVICTPGHVALYVGNGLTCEAFTEGMPLGYATIWRRSGATARRYL